MLAVTFQEPGRVELEERPDPEPIAPDDAVIKVDASGVCGSDLHIYHGRVKIEPGFTIGHEYVGTVVATGDAVTGVSVGDRVLGTFHTACGTLTMTRSFRVSETTNNGGPLPPALINAPTSVVRAVTSPSKGATRRLYFSNTRNMSRLACADLTRPLLLAKSAAL